MVAGSAQLADGTGAGDAPSHYRPQLDGLRAVAVYLVVAFHAGLARFDGGFIGVDVFFVLSGFLVTQLLLRDVRSQGRIGFARFYSRRFRRLLPASFVVLAVTAATFAAVAAPAEVIDALRSIKAAFLYVANWFFIRQSNDYFAGDINASPVVHFWSLSIEEQFYAVWPVLLAGLVVTTRRAGRAQWHVIRGVVVVAAGCSLIAALHLAGTDLNRAYYGTDTRAYELLAGAFLAMTPGLLELAHRHRRRLRWIAAASIVALFVLASSLVDLGPITRGAVVTAVTCVLIVALESVPDSLVQPALSRAPLVYLGQVSYGTYLWHWPIIVIALRLFDMSSISLFLLAAGLATGLASLSYQLLERPVRASKPLDRYRLPVIALGLTLSVIGAFVVAPAIVEGGGSEAAVTRGDGASTTASGVTRGIDWRSARGDYDAGPRCIDKPVAACTAVRGGRPHMLLIGDSNAGMLVPAFEALAEREHATLSVATHDSCPWQEGLYFANNPRRYAECVAHHRDVYGRLVPEIDPDVVVVMNRTFDDPSLITSLETPDGLVRSGTPAFLPAVQRATERSIKDLRHDGRKVVLVEPTPYATREEDPLVCLSSAKVVDECRYVVSPGPEGVERMYRTIADDRSIWSLDLDRLVCPYLPICDPVIDGKVVKMDRGHLTATYARSLGKDIDGYFRRNGILGQ